MQTAIVVCLLLLALPLSVAQAQPSPAAQLEVAINQYRVAGGVGSLAVDGRLQQAAQAKLSAMLTTGCYLPRCVNEPTAYQRQVAEGYPSNGNASELVNASQPTVSAVLALWTTEGSGSRFLLTLSTFTDVGCAVALAGAVTLYVCDFGQQLGATPTATPVFTMIPTATPPVVLGECARVWRDPTTGGEWRRYGDLQTRRDCVGF